VIARKRVRRLAFFAASFLSYGPYKPAWSDSPANNQRLLTFANKR